MTRISVVLTTCLLLICCALPMHATTQCTYSFTSGSGNSFLHFCVTVNGNIPVITTPDGYSQVGPDGEGYGICNESPAQNYTDYGTSDTGNWNPSVLISQTGSSVTIQRTTSDGNWTLTQTITKVPKTSSITVVMALKNNQSTGHVAYLVRYADAQPASGASSAIGYQSSLNGAFAFPVVLTGFGDAYLPGLQLENVGKPQFGFWQGFAQTVETGPNACAFAFNGAANYYYVNGFAPFGSIDYAYVGNVPAGGTRTVTLTYRGL